MMKKTQLLFLLLLLHSSMAICQIYKPSEAKLYQALNEEVHFLTLFVDTQEDDWEEAEKEHYMNELQKSQDWLEAQAAEYDQSIIFENETFFMHNEQTIYLKRLTRGQNSRSNIQLVMEELGYEDFDDFIEEHNFDFKKDKLKLLFFVKSNDRSHAYNYFSNAEVDLAIIYCKSTYGMMTDQYVISHEILHQFGAWDLYRGRSQSIENARRLKELFPNSIMISTNRYKPDLVVDDLTAWRVGWHRDQDEEYMSFHPRNSRKGKNDNKKSKTRIKFDLKKKNKNKE